MKNVWINGSGSVVSSSGVVGARASRRASRATRLVRALAVVASAAIPCVASATDAIRVWSAGNATNFNYFNAANWAGGSPTWVGNSDANVFNGAQHGGGPVITFNVNGGLTTYLVKSFTINNTGDTTASYSYTFNGQQNLTVGDATTGSVVPNTGLISNNSSGTLTLKNNSSIFLTNGGILANAGQIALGTGATASGVNGNPTLDIGNQSNAAGHSIIIGGAFDVTSFGVLVGTGTDTSVGGDLTKVGGGTLFLNGNSTGFNGRITIQDGAVQINKASSLGTVAGRTTILGGTATGRLELSGGVATAENLYLAGRADLTAAHILNFSGNNAVNGIIRLGAGGTGYGIESAQGTLNVNGPIQYDTASGPTTLRFGGASAGTVNGVIGAAGEPISVLKDGAGTWTLAAANGYTGATTVSQGRLSVTTAQLGGGAVSVGDGATLGVAVAGAGQALQASSLTLGTLGGPSGASLALDLGNFGNPTVPVVQAGSLTVVGPANLSVKGGGLSLGQIPLIGYGAGGIGGLGLAGITLQGLPARVTANLIDDPANSRLKLNVTAFDIPKWTGAVDGNWDIDDGSGSGTQNWREKNSGIATRYLQGAAGTDGVLFDDTAGVPTTVNLTTVLTPAGVTIDADTNAFTFTGNGILSGATGITKKGNSTFVLANFGLNDYTGTTSILGGTLQSGDGITGGAGQLGSGAIINQGALILNRPDSYTLANDISGAGAITKLGAGTATLTGNSTYTGTLTVSAGVLKLGNTTALGAAAGGTFVNGTGSIDVNGLLVGAAEAITISGSGSGSVATLTNSGAGGATAGFKNVTLAGDVRFGGAGRWDIRDNPGALNGAGFGVTKIGANTIFLSNIGETHLGNVTVTSGRLSFQGDTTLGDQAGTITVQTDGELAFENSTVVHTKPIVLDGGKIFYPSGTNNRIDGPITIGPQDVSLAFQGAGNLLINGPISGPANLTKLGTGVLTLAGANTYEGGTTLSAGTLVFANPGAIPVTGPINFLGTGAVGFGFAFDQALLGSKIAGGAQIGTVALAADNANNLDFSAAGLGYSAISLGAVGATPRTYSGQLTPFGSSYLLGGGGGVLNYAGTISGTNSINIGTAGVGTVVLSAANTYTGTTTITAGTLRIGNAAALGPAPKLDLAAAGIVDLNGFDVSVAGLTGAGGAVITDNSATPGTSRLIANIPVGGSFTYTGSVNNGAAGRVLSLVKSGAGTLILNRPNGSNYTGCTVVEAGRLEVRTNNAQVLPNGSDLTFTGSGTFAAANNGAANIANAALTLGKLNFQAGEGVVESQKQLDSATHVLTFSQVPTRSPGATGRFTLNGTNDPSAYKVVIASSPTPGQSFDGGIFFGADQFAAYDPAGYVRGLNYATDAGAANVNLSANQATFGAVTDKDVQVSSTGGSFSITGQTTETIRTLRLAGASSLTLGAGQTLTLSGAGILKAGGGEAILSGAAGSAITVPAGKDLVISTGSDSDTVTLNAPVQSPLGIVKAGLGTLAFSGSGADTGLIRVNSGTVLFANAGAFPNAGNLLLNDNTAVGFGFAVDQAFLASHLPATTKTISVAIGADNANNFDFSAAGLNYPNASLGAVGPTPRTFTGQLTPAGTVYRLGGGGGTLVYASPIAGNNSVNVGSAGSGTVVLAAANTFTGGAVAAGGTLKIGNAKALGVTPNSLNVLGAGTVDLNGFDVTVAGLSGVAGGVITDSSATAGVTTLTVDIPTGSSTYTASINDGANGRRLSLRKAGDGNLLLNRPNGNNYTGGTFVERGRLEVRDNNAQVLALNSDVTFTGNGIFAAVNNGAATVTNASLSLGQLNFAANNGTVESNKLNASTTNTLTFAQLNRAAGATGNFILVNTTDSAAYKVALTNAPTAGQSINGGTYFGGDQFAAYDAAGYVRPLNYSDANAVDVPLGSDQPDLGDVAGKDVQIGSSGGSITAQSSQSVRTLRIAGPSNLNVAAGQTLAIAEGGIIKAGGGESSITAGGAGAAVASPIKDFVVHTVTATDVVSVTAALQSPLGLTKTGAGTLNLAGNASALGTGPGAGIWVNAGTLHTTTATLPAPVTVARSARFEVESSLAAPALTVKGDATAVILDGPGGAVTPRIVKLGGLNVDAGSAAAPTTTGGTLDIRSNAVIIDYAVASASPLGNATDGASVAALIKRGFNDGGAGGQWAGRGITSSTAQAPTGGVPLAIGFAEASALLGITGEQTGTFLDQTVDASSILVRTTVAGDTNLDGVTGFSDLVAIAQHYDQAGQTWFTGDVNYDGNVSFPDLVIIAQNYDRSLGLPAAVPGASVDFNEQWAAALATAVPEPGTVGLLAGVVTAAVSRRRRRRA